MSAAELFRQPRIFTRGTDTSSLMSGMKEISNRELTVADELV